MTCILWLASFFFFTKWSHWISDIGKDKTFTIIGKCSYFWKLHIRFPFFLLSEFKKKGAGLFSRCITFYNFKTHPQVLVLIKEKCVHITSIHSFSVASTRQFFVGQSVGSSTLPSLHSLLLNHTRLWGLSKAHIIFRIKC